MFHYSLWDYCHLNLLAVIYTSISQTFSHLGPLNTNKTTDPKCDKGILSQGPWIRWWHWCLITESVWKPWKKIIIHSIIIIVKLNVFKFPFLLGNRWNSPNDPWGSPDPTLRTTDLKTLLKLTLMAIYLTTSCLDKFGWKCPNSLSLFSNCFCATKF